MSIFSSQTICQAISLRGARLRIGAVVGAFRNARDHVARRLRFVLPELGEQRSFVHAGLLTYSMIMVSAFLCRPLRGEEQQRHAGVAGHERPCRGQPQGRVPERPLIGMHQADGG